MVSFPPAQKNTPSTNAAFKSLGDANAILTSYSPASTTGAGMGKFSARFNIVPASWTQEAQIVYSFPSFPGYLADGTSRDMITLAVSVRVQYDYFVVDPSAILGANIKDSGGNLIQRVNRRLDIPIINKSQFYWVVNGIPDFSKVTLAIIPAAGREVQIGWTEQSSTTPDGITTTRLIPLFQLYLPTLPTLEVYEKWITNAAKNGWSSTVWDGKTMEDAGSTTTGQIVAEDSKNSIFAGNIIERASQFVLVK
jgi:hypothetical protein